MSRIARPCLITLGTTSSIVLGSAEVQIIAPEGLEVSVEGSGFSIGLQSGAILYSGSLAEFHAMIRRVTVEAVAALKRPAASVRFGLAYRSAPILGGMMFPAIRTLAAIAMAGVTFFAEAAQAQMAPSTSPTPAIQGASAAQPSPIEITKVVTWFTDDRTRYICLNFKNTSDKPIVAVKFAIAEFDSFGSANNFKGTRSGIFSPGIDINGPTMFKSGRLDPENTTDMFKNCWFNANDALGLNNLIQIKAGVVAARYQDGTIWQSQDATRGDNVFTYTLGTNGYR